MLAVGDSSGVSWARFFVPINVTHRSYRYGTRISLAEQPRHRRQVSENAEEQPNCLHQGMDEVGNDHIRLMQKRKQQ